MVDLTQFGQIKGKNELTIMKLEIHRNQEWVTLNIKLSTGLKVFYFCSLPYDDWGEF